MKKLFGLFMLLGGCAAGIMPANPPTGDASFDGTYTGTVSAIVPAACGQAGGSIVMQVTNGGLSMRLLGGTALVTAKVNPGGAISDASFSGPAWTGTSTGSGQITDGRVTLSLLTQDPTFRRPCSWQYQAQKAV